MLVAIPPGKTPSKDELLDGACQNPDGFGYAIMVSDTEIISKRTMNANESIDDFLKVRAEHPDGYAMWHCRIATHGTKTVDNCHPFQLAHDPLTYLGHNGILGVTLEKGETRSDTAFFAQDLLPSIGGVRALDNPFMLHLLEDWVKPSKIVVLTVNPAAKKNFYILNKAAGNEDKDGIWWSNSYHRGARSRRDTPPPTQKYYQDRDESYLTRCWNMNTRRDEEILGIFQQGEYLPAECDNEDNTHPVDDRNGHLPYCFLCTMRFDKKLEWTESDPKAVWMMTRSKDGRKEISYILMNKHDLAKQAQTKVYYHQVEKECATIGRKTKWAYCFTHDFSWNDAYGRNPMFHKAPSCSMAGTNGSHPWCTTHQVAVDQDGVVRDPKVPTPIPTTKNNSPSGSGDTKPTRKQIEYKDAGWDDLDNNSIDIICKACKGVMDFDRVWTFGYCEHCNTCVECDTIMDNCLCFVPGRRNTGY